ncbi:hypothetical protein ACJIZ3_016078 [Penstemon smallii]|uniref:Uncharacterized protein n=1 Tax=Penstemon smallii TaxID=265156 RepID=A0ABD3RPF2_9LAMI
MSLENEDRMSPDKASGKPVVYMKPKFSYSREFLLSLSDLDVCKKLPSGFDESLLSELKDASQNLPDRPRIPGSLPLQGFRRNEYGSSPPTRGGSGNYSRGNYGKWESRSSGRSDRDTDSQSDKDSDSGRRYGHQSQRSWQSPEHDGLLGSGSFPRPSGYVGGISAPKVRTNELNNQLSKTNEPYHPPRPYKALPYSRRDTDSYNDETFGFSELTSEDRSEEEKKRRASFETMRKEQQKSLQEKHKAGGVSDLFEVLEEGKEEKGVFRNNEVEISAATSISSNDLEKSSFASNSPVTRPLVPPGFRNNILEKSSGFKSLNRPPLSEVEKPETEETLINVEANLVQDGNNDGLERQLTQEISLVDEQPSEKTQHVPLLNNGASMNLYPSLHVPVKKLGMEDQLTCASSQLDSHETLNDPDIVELNAEVLEDKTVGVSNKKYSTSVLKKIFGSTLPMNDCGSSSAEHHGSKPEETRSPDSVKSSKFAQWFSEEEAKAPDDISFLKPTNIMSLLVSGRDQVSDAQAAEHFPNNYKTLEKSNKLTPEMPSASNGISDQVSANNKEEPVPNVLTCEDLENSILSEYSARTTIVQPILKSRGRTGPNIDKPGINADGNASLHLLSLLQKVTDQTHTTPEYGTDINLGNKLLVSQENDAGTTFSEPIVENRKNIPNSGNTLTLETLFGTAFMKELQSVEAPVSVQRGSNETARVDVLDSHGLPFPSKDNNISFPTIDKIGVQRPSYDSGLASDLRQTTKLSESENWLGFDVSQSELPSSKHHTEAVPRHIGFGGIPEFRMTEEDNFSVAGHENHRISKFMHTGSSSSNAKLSSDAAIDITEKLAAAAALSAVVKDERVMAGSGRLPFPRGPYEQIEPEIHHRNHLQQSSQFQPPQMSQMRPLYHHLESHPSQMSSQMKFSSPEPTFSHNSPPAHHQFPLNIVGSPFHQSNVARYDIPSQHPMLHQMQMSSTHILPDFPRNGPLSHHGNQAAGLIHEMNQMQGFPIGPRPPNSLGVPMPGPNASPGNNSSDAFRRLIEMELRGNSKQIQPLAPGHSPGIYGQEVDLGFQYR